MIPGLEKAPPDAVLAVLRGWQADLAHSRSLADFVKCAWPLVESRPLVWNWHLDALCDHLEMINAGEVRALIAMFPPRHSKPVCVESRVVTRRGVVRLGDVVVGDEVLTHNGRFRRVSAVHDQGDLPIVTIKTLSGRTARAAPEHPFLTPRGWVAAGKLKVRDLLGVPRVRDPWIGSMPPEEARLLGYFVGDGSTKFGAASITCFDPEQLPDVLECIRACGFVAGNSVSKGRINVSGGVRLWLDQYGLRGKGSRDKRIPPGVFAGGVNAIRHFLAAYFACDGTVTRKASARKDLCLSMVTVSDGLAADLVLAFGLLGIRARKRVRVIKSQFIPKTHVGDYTANYIDITSADDANRFQELIPILGVKARKLATWQINRRFFDQDLAGDPIVEIGMDWPSPCRCLTVEEDESFTVEGLAVHNSLVTTVFWPAWTWLRRDVIGRIAGPRTSFAFASWSASLSIDHNLALRRLVATDWYQRAAGGLAVDPQVDRSDNFRLIPGGRAFATSVNSTVMGFGFDVRVVDDPNNLQTIDSAADRAAVKRFYDEVWKSRVEDPKASAEVIIMQRGHQDDLVGHLLAGPRAKEFTVLCLPAEYDPDHPHRWAGDPRTVPGELLDKPRFGDEGYKTIAPATAFGRAAQLQQNPTARGAGVFAKAQWQFADDYPRQVRLVRYWDKAATAEGAAADPDYTAGVLGGFDALGLFWLVDVIRGRWSSREVEQRIRLTAYEIDGSKIPIWIEQEPGSSGKDVIGFYQRLLRGFAVRGDRPTGHKLVRVDPLLAAVEAGNVVLVRRRYIGNGHGVGAEACTWINAFLAECDLFTGDESTHDDQVVAAAGCFSRAAATGKFSAGRLLGV